MIQNGDSDVGLLTELDVILRPGAAFLMAFGTDIKWADQFFAIMRWTVDNGTKVFVGIEKIKDNFGLITDEEVRQAFI